jgi:hypothetical protein
MTNEQSWKIKRLSRNPRVAVAASTLRGTVAVVIFAPDRRPASDSQHADADRWCPAAPARRDPGRLSPVRLGWVGSAPPGMAGVASGSDRHRRPSFAPRTEWPGSSACSAAAAAYLTGETGLFTLAGVATTALVLARRYRSLRSTESDERRTQTGEHLSLNRRSRRSQAT